MCLPVSCLKSYLIIAGFLTLVVGVIVFSFSAANMSSDDIIWFGNALTDKSKITTGGLVCGIFVVISGIGTIYGSWKKKNLILAISNLLNCVFFIAFLVMGILGFTVIYGLFSDSCEQNQWLSSYQAISQAGQQNFCKSPCGCNFYNTSSFSQDIIKTITVNPQGPTNYQGCGTYDETQQNIMSVLANLETHFFCSGFCQASPIYIFSNVNNGPPQTDQNCYSLVSEIVQKYGKNISAVNLLVAVVLFINILLSCCLCCHPKRKALGNVYKRMEFYDNEEKSMDENLIVKQ